MVLRQAAQLTKHTKPEWPACATYSGTLPNMISAVLLPARCTSSKTHSHCDPAHAEDSLFALPQDRILLQQLTESLRDALAAAKQTIQYCRMTDAHNVVERGSCPC